MPEMKANPAEMGDLLKAVDNEMAAGRDKGDPTEKRLHVTLEDRELWSKFQVLTNEMIVTKSGRRMFPVKRVTITGLDPTAIYSVVADFVPVDGHRWKYVNGEWVAGGKAEPASPNTAYVHPDSPNFGAHWMKEPVSFSKVKLTNKMQGSGQIMLNSLHKYQPRVHIIRMGAGDEKRTLATHAFTETQFVAVTAYQNEEITALKIKYNPFAKAFQDAKERPDQKDYTGSFDDVMDSDQKRLSHLTSPWYLGAAAAAAGGHHSTYPTSHQLHTSLGLSHPCDRLGALRDHRHTPYTHPFHRRTAAHAGTYAHDVSSNLSSVLGMTSAADAWPHNMMTAAGAHHHHHQGHHMALPAPSQPHHQPHHHQYMWNLAAQAAPNQSCAVSQYLRSGGYLPETTASTTAQLGLPVTTSTASPLGLDHHHHHSHHATTTPPTYDTHVQLLAHSATEGSAATSGFPSAHHVTRTSSAATWRPLSPSSSSFKVEACNM